MRSVPCWIAVHLCVTLIDHPLSKDSLPFANAFRHKKKHLGIIVTHVDPKFSCLGILTDMGSVHPWRPYVDVDYKG